MKKVTLDICSHFFRLKGLTLITFTFISTSMYSQEHTILDGIESKIEFSGGLSSGDNAPFWISSNKYGLSSVERNSGYLRAGLFRSTEVDSTRNWKIGYGIDLAGTVNHTAPFIIQQAYGEVEWNVFTLSLGSKERPIDLRNNELTSGGLSVGINARPIPQIRMDIDYFSFPFTNGWWKWKMRCSYGMFTDDNWQTDFIEESDNLSTAKHTKNVLYHEKACYWKFGKEKVFPLTFEIGIQLCTQFGGTIYNLNTSRWSGDTDSGNNSFHFDKYKAPSGIGAFWDALLCRGADAGDGAFTNVAGNTIGSYNMRLQYSGKSVKVGVYFERLFEDHSMLTLQYGIYDHLLGLEIELPKFKYITNIVYEHISTKDQSGAVYHDGTNNLNDDVFGRDNYYNHRDYTGWQHWGMAIGNPLITSPIYNDDGTIYFYNNRLVAHHIGISGEPTKNIHYRILYSYSSNWGTYEYPFDDIKYQTSILAELQYKIPKKRLSFKASIGYDKGDIYKENLGFQLGITKTISVTK